MSLSHHLVIRKLIAGLFLAVSLLVPLKVVFACAMMDQVVDRCCCEPSLKDHPQHQKANTGDCCHLIYIPTANHDSLSTAGKAPLVTHLDNLDLPPALPPREAGPDPPTLLASRGSTYLSTPLPWLNGSQTYLLTLRLRN